MVFCTLPRLAICGLLGFFLVPAAAQRAPNGSVGTIDFRYPDIIVSPRVECPFEGVFPHPRDCRWYYRCYDTFGFGFYWRAYFECEPGTAFSDALDQCVFQGDGNGCLVEEASVSSCREELLGCRDEDICAPSSIGTSFIYRTQVCTTANKICSGSPNNALCSEGYLYDTGKRNCIEEGALCQQSTPRPPNDFPLTCEDQVSSCMDVNLCPQGQAPKVHRFCNVNSYCYHQDGRSSVSNKCPELYAFDVFANECINVTKIAMEAECGNNVEEPEFLQCVVESESCSVYQSCETRESFLGCVSSFMCGAAAPRSNVCPYGAVYVPKTNKCVHVPSSRTLGGQPTGGIESPCIFTNIESPTLPPTSPGTSPTSTYDPEYPSLPIGFDDVSVYIDQFQCRAPGEVPTAPRHRSLKCKNKPRCFPSGDKKTYNVCRKYFVCDRNNILSVSDCGKQSFFDFSSKSCKLQNQLPGSNCPERNKPSTPTEVTAPPTTPEIPAYYPEYPPLPIGSNDVTRFIDVYQCGGLGEVPIAPRHPALMCVDRKRCFAAGTKKTYNVCQKYYVCDQYNTVSMEDCEANSFFDFSSKSCKPLNQLPGTECPDGDLPSSPNGQTTPDGATSPVVTTPPPEGGPNPGSLISPQVTETGGMEGETGDEETPSAAVGVGTGANGTSPVGETGANGTIGETGDKGTLPPPISSLTDKPDVTTSPNRPITVSLNSTVTCTYDGEIPEMEKIVEKQNCNLEAICNGAKFLKMEIRCSTFYKCVLDTDLKPVLTECDNAEEVFFPDKKTCEVPTGETCGVVFYYWVSQRNAFELVENTRDNIEKISLQERLRPSAQTRGPNYAPQIQQNQNLVFPTQQQPQSFGLQHPSNAWNSGSQKQYNTNFAQQYQNPHAVVNEGKRHHTLNPHVPEPQQFGVMAQKHEQAPQPNLDGTLFQYPTVGQTLRQVSNIQQSVYPQPQFRPNNVSSFTLFSGQEFGDQGYLNPSTSVDPGFVNQQTPGTVYSNTPSDYNFMQKETSFRTSDGQQSGNLRHHSNPGIPNHAFMSNQNVRPQDYSTRQIIGNEGNLLSRISGTPEMQQQPLSSFQQRHPFLGNIQNPQNQFRQLNSI